MHLETPRCPHTFSFGSYAWILLNSYNNTIEIYAVEHFFYNTRHLAVFQKHLSHHDQLGVTLIHPAQD